MANRMRVQKTPNGQFIVTVPKAVAEALGYRKGTVLEFKFNDMKELVVKRV
jgi:bifunctional DNA-binding transcriptional regulator/antitoxin component of YhaV-PrlF toxin-antitoxin module